METNVILPPDEILTYIFSFCFSEWKTIFSIASVCKHWNVLVDRLIRTLLHSNQAKSMASTWENFTKEGNSFSSSSNICGSLIGIGGFSHVFTLSRIPCLCLKFAFGGKSTVESSEEIAKKRIEAWAVVNQKMMKLKEQLDNKQVYLTALDVYGKAFYHWSSGIEVELMSTEQVSELVYQEFKLLFELQQADVLRVPNQHFNMYHQSSPRIIVKPLQSNKASTMLNILFPRVLFYGKLNERSFYIMERLKGITLRKLLANASYGPTATHTLAIDLIPPLIKLVTDLNFLLNTIKFWHGDLKPDNIFIDISPNGEVSIRLIDPVVRNVEAEHSFIGWRFTRVLSVPYNPKGLAAEKGDVYSLLMILYEIASGSPLFRPKEEIRWDLDSYYLNQNLEGLKQDIQLKMKRFEKNPFIITILKRISETEMKKNTLSSLINLLQEYKQKSPLEIYIPPNLITNF